MKNIYKIGKELFITSEEEIKVGDFFIHSSHGISNVYKAKSVALESIITTCDNVGWIQYCKKIILTDSNLIKDGVQAIDDDFLNWFVKNPCDYVEVEEVYFHGSGYYKANELSEIEKNRHRFMKEYKIIIPQEEPKQETIEEVAIKLSKEAYKKHSVEDDRLSLDEQIQRSGGFSVGFKEGMKEGAKWQSKKMYSEEEVRKIAIDAYAMGRKNILIGGFNKWFNEKKK